MIRRLIVPVLVLIGLLGGLVFSVGWAVRSKQAWPWLGRVPLVGGMLRQAELRELGFRSPQEQRLFTAPVATLESHGMRFHLLGARYDPMRLEVLYQVEGEGEIYEYEDLKVEIDRISDDPGIGITYQPLEQTRWLGRLGSRGLWAPDAGDQVEIEVTARFFDQEQRVTLTADRRELAAYYHMTQTDLADAHEGLTLRLTQIVTTTDRLFVALKTESPDKVDRDIPYSYDPIKLWLETAAGRLVSTRTIFSMSGLTWYEFERPKGAATLYIDRHPIQRATEIRWPLRLDAAAQVDDALVRVTELTRSGQSLTIRWTYQGSSKLLGVERPTLITEDGSAVESPQGRKSFHDSLDRYGNRSFGFTLTIPDGFEPVAVEATGAAFMAEGPWRFQLPPLTGN